ncbi:MAG: hypothetical protein OEZ22_12445 [Spirochaetia bacterium]|nr:hypothetical protein [Spirochaetia bacterium]
MIHPMIIHLPLGLMFIVPVILYLLWVKNKENANEPLIKNGIWQILASVVTIMLIGSIAAMISGEADEEIVEKLISESIIEGHEDMAKIFTISVFILTALSLSLAFLKDNLRKLTIKILLLFSVIVIALGGLTGKKGGELVYQHKAANAFGNAGNLQIETNTQNTNKEEIKSKENKKKDHDDDDDEDDD